MKRFIFITASLLSLVTVSGSLSTGIAAAETVPSKGYNVAFSKTSVADVLGILFPGETAIPSTQVNLDAPLIATPNERVPIRVSSDLGNITTVAIVTHNNTTPLNSVVRLYGADGYYSTNIRVERGSKITAYVQTSDGLFSATSRVKLSLGAYGIHNNIPVRMQTAKPANREFIRMKLRSGKIRTVVQVLISHPLEISPTFQTDQENQPVKTHIEKVEFEKNGNLLAQAYLDGNAAKKLLTSIAFKQSKTGDSISSSWTDNMGHSGKVESELN